MVSYKELEIIVKNLPIPDDHKIKLVELTKPVYEFHDFIKTKLGLSDEATEKLIEVHAKSKLSELKLDDFSSDDNLLEVIVKIYMELAEYHGFEKSKEFGNAISELVKAMDSGTF